MLGIFIGVVSGAIQFFLLTKLTGAVTGGKFGKKTVLFALTQFFFPFVVLLTCAFLIYDELMRVVIGLLAVFIISSVVKFFMISRTNKK